MASFAIIAEGVTDQAVLENILLGYFRGDDDEPVVNRYWPKPAVKGSADDQGGWTLVFRSLREGKHREALQFNDYVVVHVDTDRCTDPGYDVSPRAAEGPALSPGELVERVKERLVGVMGAEFYAQNEARVIFAIAVDAIECWLLPLLYENEAAKKSKVTGCLAAADWKLRVLKQVPLSSADGSKSLASYERVSKEYRRKLMKHRADNPSLDIFVRRLDAIGVAEGAGGQEKTGTPAGEP